MTPSPSIEGTPTAHAAPDADRFGNPVDPVVRYARGQILAGEVEEARRQQQAYRLVRERFARLGDAGVHNLTGLIRAFPFGADDDEAMRSYVHFMARHHRELEDLALDRLGGDPAVHDGFLATRVSAGILAVMLALVRPGDRVLSLVPADRSHPSLRQGVALAQAHFREAVGIDTFETALAAGPPPQLVVITTIAPSKHHLAADEALRAVSLARDAGALVMLDDAHMAARVALYDEPPGLAFGPPDVTVWSLDKHCGGPRSGFVAGRRDLVARIRARALSLGLEAQLGQYLAGLRALEAFDPEPIRVAGALAEAVHGRLRGDLGDGVYLAGAGVALAGDELLAIALARAGRNASPLVPIEAVALAAMHILEAHGMVTIPAVGMPGAACAYRLMMYPDGGRLGADLLVQATGDALDHVAGLLGDPDGARAVLLGD